MASESGFDSERGDVYEASYMHLSKYSGMMTAHIVFMIVAWVFALPVGEYHRSPNRPRKNNDRPI